MYSLARIGAAQVRFEGLSVHICAGRGSAAFCVIVPDRASRDLERLKKSSPTKVSHYTLVMTLVMWSGSSGSTTHNITSNSNDSQTHAEIDSEVIAKNRHTRKHTNKRTSLRAYMLMWVAAGRPRSRSTMTHRFFSDFPSVQCGVAGGRLCLTQVFKTHESFFLIVFFPTFAAFIHSFP